MRLGWMWPLRISCLMLCALLAACGFDAPPPHRTPAPAMPRPPLSRLAVTLTVPADRIAAFLDARTQRRIAALHGQKVKCGIGRCRLDLVATRTGPVTAAAEDGALAIGLPFAVEARLASPGFLSFLHATGTAEGEARAQTALTLRPDWRLASHVTGMVHLDNGHLRAGPIVTNIADVWNGNEDALSRPLWRMLDRQIARIDLKKPVAAFWRRAFTPMRIGNAPAAWLVLRPEAIGVTQPVIRDGMVTLSLSVAARGRVVVQDKPPVGPPAPLPPATPMAAPSRAFSFSVPFLLPYGEASRLALASLRKKPPHMAGMTLRFSRLAVLPSGHDVVVETRVCAAPDWDPTGWLASCGTVWLRGVPRFDAVRKTIRVTDLHYDIASAGAVLRGLKAMAGDRLAGLLQAHLVFDESRPIARLKAQLAAALAKPEGRDVVVSGRLESFAPPTFSWTRDGFVALFTAQGTVRATLEGL